MDLNCNSQGLFYL
uniref:Uncharacterized protein n=1 Tax=Arundo donax TaxID=35708 RepID=A0A0A9DZL9_ARUDO